MIMFMIDILAFAAARLALARHVAATSAIATFEQDRECETPRLLSPVSYLCYDAGSSRARFAVARPGSRQAAGCTSRSSQLG
jgi:hypothetical protein